MGCSTSKNAVAAVEVDVKEATSATASNGSSDNAMDTFTSKEKSFNAVYPPAEAFVVSLAAETDEGRSDRPLNSDSLETAENHIIKKPPKRLQQLMEQAQLSTEASPKRIADLNEKLNKAEVRRQNYLQQKIAGIQRTTQMCDKNPDRWKNKFLDDTPKTAPLLNMHRKHKPWRPEIHPD